MNIKTQYDIGEEAYLKSDPYQYKRQIIEININPGSFLMYKLTVGVEASWHHEIELRRDKDEVLKLTGD